MIPNLIGAAIGVAVVALARLAQSIWWKHEDRRDGRLRQARFDGLMLGTFGVQWDPKTRTDVKRKTY